MNLPNYFLADLPPEATLSPAMIAEACQTLKRNREHYLANRTAESLVKVLSDVADGWLQAENPFRKLALELGPARTGFSRETLGRGLDNYFRQLTRENFHALLVQEFGDARRLDAMTATVAEQKQNRMAIANAPEFQVHIAAGNIPNPTLTSIVFGLLARSAQFVKCASGSAFLPRLFAHSIYDADPKLGACLEIAEWRGGNAALENALFAEADCVTATGSDETLTAIRAQLPVKTRFLGYGHRVSFGFVAHESLYGSQAKK
ncbi:MAG TPA: acyl-CoA reductase, partial [Candidatus Baltobacteraceae bacterium]|nr:acyl-CoA reductase [Candidatus Baltobacteraceae bacterium]